MLLLGIRDKEAGFVKGRGVKKGGAKRNRGGVVLGNLKQIFCISFLFDCSRNNSSTTLITYISFIFYSFIVDFISRLLVNLVIHNKKEKFKFKFDRNDKINGREGKFHLFLFSSNEVLRRLDTF